MRKPAYVALLGTDRMQATAARLGGMMVRATSGSIQDAKERMVHDHDTRLGIGT